MFAQDYSGASYDQKWSKDCWYCLVLPIRSYCAFLLPLVSLQCTCRWDKPVIVYGDDTVDKGHPVVAFLAKEKRAKSVSVYKEG